MTALVRRREEVAPVACPCGAATRIITAADGAPASLHVVSIKRDSAVHYHLKTTEIYYVLKGSGSIFLDGREMPVAAGSAVLIPPGVRHRAAGDLEIVNVVCPPFDPSDEYCVASDG